MALGLPRRASRAFCGSEHVVFCVPWRGEVQGHLTDRALPSVEQWQMVKALSFLLWCFWEDGLPFQP